MVWSITKILEKQNRVVTKHRYAGVKSESRRTLMRRIKQLLRVVILYSTILLTLNYLKFLIHGPFARRFTA
jgi:hypothetical protein